jgi:hypothetical protein
MAALPPARLKGNVSVGRYRLAFAREPEAWGFKAVLLEDIVQHRPWEQRSELARRSADVNEIAAVVACKKVLGRNRVKQVLKVTLRPTSWHVE